MSFSNRQGFTLLEVLVAFTIASLALIILYRSSGESVGAVEVSSRYMQAASRAQSHLAALTANPSLSFGESAGDDGDEFHWHIVVAPALSGGENEALKYAHEQLYAVTVDISWQEMAHRRVLTLNTMSFSAVPAETLQ